MECDKRKVRHIDLKAKVPLDTVLDPMMIG